MTYFEPPPLPGSGSGKEPVDPYASPVDPYASSAPTVGRPPIVPGPGSAPGPAPTAPWGPPAQYQHPRGTTILVLGILSVVFVQILGPVAWVMGRSTLREIDASGRPTANRSSVQAGMVLGIIGTVMCLFGVLWAIGFVTLVVLGS